MAALAPGHEGPNRTRIRCSQDRILVPSTCDALAADMNEARPSSPPTPRELRDFARSDALEAGNAGRLADRGRGLTFRLHDDRLSGNGRKPRRRLAHPGRTQERIEADTLTGACRTPELPAMNRARLGDGGSEGAAGVAARDRDRPRPGGVPSASTSPWELHARRSLSGRQRYPASGSMSSLITARMSSSSSGSMFSLNLTRRSRSSTIAGPSPVNHSIVWRST